MEFRPAIATIAGYYQAADSFLFPTPYDAFGMVISEAMACGLPIVGSDRSSMPEAVTDGREGLLRPPQVEPLALAIEQIRGNHEIRKRMAIAARERAVRDFGVQRMGRDYLSLLGRLS